MVNRNYKIYTLQILECYKKLNKNRFEIKKIHSNKETKRITNLFQPSQNGEKQEMFSLCS